MLSDIVERLRGGVYGIDRIPLCKEAADEIERLRRELGHAESYAARYQWLRQFEVDSYRACGSREKLDAEIDAGIVHDSNHQSTSKGADHA